VPGHPVADAVCIGETMAVLVPEQPGPLEQAEVFRRGVGGAESNVACGLAGLGVSASWISRVGADGFGRHIVTQLAQRGVDTSAVAVDPHRPTGLYVKEIGQDGGHSKLHYYRSDSAASMLSPESLDAPEAATLLSKARLIHLTGITAALGFRAGRNGGRRLVEAVLDRRRPGQLVSFDLNWRPGMWHRLDGDSQRPADILAELANRADVVLLGADEAEALFGTDDPQRLRALLPDPRVLVVKDSGHRVTAFDDEGVVTEPALAVEVVEPIGAGDAFAAGYLAALLRGYDQRRRLRLGHVCAASVLMVDGDHCPPPTPGLLTALLDSSASQWSAIRAARGGFAEAAP
jgi:2-dehydro-3-deoxygluconokinase